MFIIIKHTPWGKSGQKVYIYWTGSGDVYDAAPPTQVFSGDGH
ncbi:hypothetical protein [Crinalium epipsammum]|nr:hypothetical protein [Crinalium epipsammum]